MPIPDTIIPAEKPKEEHYDILANNPLLRALAALLDAEEAYSRKEIGHDELMAAQRLVDVLFFEFHARLKAGDKNKNWQLRSN